MNIIECLKSIPNNPIILESKYMSDEDYHSIKVNTELAKKNLRGKKDALYLIKAGYILKDKHPKYLKLFNNHLENVVIKRNKKITKEGTYVLDGKTPIYSFSKRSFYHEALHMASSYYDDEREIYYIGFSYFDTQLKIDIGTGLNEGYVSLLEDRDLNNDSSIYDFNAETGDFYPACYEVANAFARQIEVIVGKDRMEELFFKADLQGLIEELRNYMSFDEVMFILKGIDLASSQFKRLPIFTGHIMAVQEKLENVVANYMPEKMEEFNKHLVYYEDGDYSLEKICVECEKLKQKSRVRKKS